MLKISEVNLQGVSPEVAVQNAEPPPPMETAGFQKARGILDMIQKSKLAAKSPGSTVTLPQIEKLLDKKMESRNDVDTAKNIGGHVIGGGASGNFVGKATNLVRNAVRSHRGHKAIASGNSKLELAATSIGALTGLAEFARKRKKAALKAKTASPAMNLKATQQVGTTGLHAGARSGPSAVQQIGARHIGNKFVSKTAQVTPMKKIAASSQTSEILDQVKRMVMTREDMRAEADAQFGQYAKDARKDAQKLMEKLFVQTPAAQTMAPVLQKQASITPAVDAFFEKNAAAFGLTEAQLNFPELLKVAAGRSAASPMPSPQLVSRAARSVTPESGPTASRSMMSGGSA
jgi:hypothetical protein